MSIKQTKTMLKEKNSVKGCKRTFSADQFFVQNVCPKNIGYKIIVFSQILKNSLKSLCWYLFRCKNLVQFRVNITFCVEMISCPGLKHNSCKRCFSQIEGF